ncbi:hypothetical protein OIU85_004572 [Salix viminalis]|uniref:Uncharacterized protein n=1 Tax=Salix viminalis TaxID=40686 RepID=A0A9Q0PTG3_SALVM|nr:hypothetical protein OIU85_004572 [Salix viminalis]
MPFPQSTGKWIVKHKSFSECVSNDLDGVFPLHGGAVAIKVQDRNLEAKAFLVIDVRQRFELMRGGLRWFD